jgi:hypothetical protein
MIALLLLPSSSALAQDAPPFTQDELISLVGEAVVDEAVEASEEVRKAKEILDIVLKKKGTAEEQAKAEQDVENAQTRYNKAQKNLDTARVDAFASQCDKSPAEIQAMRDSGMGWGLIAKECGIHPSASGKGKGKDKVKNKDKGQGKGSTKNK